MAFTTIPANWKVSGSYTEFDLLSGYEGLQPVDKNVLILAQQLPTLFEAENFVNGAIGAGTSWSVNSADVTFAGGKAAWAYSGGAASTLTQTLVVMATIRTVKANTWYKFTYTVSGKANTPTANIASGFAGVTTALTITDGIQTTYVKTAAVPTDFVITSTLTAGMAFSLDDLSIKEVKYVDTPVEITSIGQSLATFGAHSIAHIMVKNVFDINKYSSVWVCPLADEVASAATTYTWTLSGAPSSGQYIFKIGNRTFDITAATIDAYAIAIKAAVNADEFCPFTIDYTGSSTPYVFTLTASNKGTLNKYCRVYFSKYPTGITVSAIVQSAGTTDPVLTTALTACEKLSAAIYAFPFVVSASYIATLKTHIENISDALIQNPAKFIWASNDLVDTQAAIKTLAGTTTNYWRGHPGYFPYTDNLPYEIAAQLAGAFSKQPRPGDSIDKFPLNLHCPATGYYLTQTECNSLLIAGVMPIIVEGGVAKLLRAVTCCTSVNGVAIPKLMDIETSTALDYIRKNVKALEEAHYLNKKNNAETRENLRNDIYALLLKFQEPEYEITPNVEENLAGILVNEDGTDPGRCNVIIPTDIVMGLHVIANQIRLI
jgi:phage tail sheath gpL-like